jgi:hypothetical protein
MRLLAASAAAAALLLAPSSAHAYSAGAGTVTIPASSFFRPTTGVAGAGNCTYAGAVLTASVAGVAVTGGFATSRVQCTVENASGFALLSLDAAATFGGNVRSTTGLLFDVPVRICGTVTVDSAEWGPASQTACAAVLPGNPK